MRNIDPLSEQLLTLAQAAKLIPGRPNISTLWRWVRTGVRGAVLESVLVGGKRYTSREAIDRFFTATNAAPGEPTVRTARQRAKSIDAAERELTEAGI